MRYVDYEPKATKTELWVVFFVAISFIVLAATMFYVGSDNSGNRDVNDYSNRYILYTKDSRTNLCYAYQTHNQESFVNVPCSPEVEKHLNK